MAILTNNVDTALSLLNVDPVTGNSADVNFNVIFNGFIMSPLLLAIQCFGENQGETTIISELLKKYADINHKEALTGFNCLIMACHLTTESDSL